MKKAIILLCSATFLLGCATVQSIIKSTFPYTATVVVPADTPAGKVVTASFAASSFDEIFGNKEGKSYVRDVVMASARLTAVKPGDQNLGIFRSVKLYLSNGAGYQIMVASRSDIQENIGPVLALDIDNTKILDTYLMGEDLHIRIEYILRSKSESDVSLRASLGFVAAPNPQQ
ncbi:MULTISPECIES: hypothetical protein [Pedobacter]|uniref:hypothetical protein n=1 Tax=Pedobacter TaxID=84567 RepID=UPI00210D246A|nr:MULTISPECIES: hypothetical protein [unclassified Pedobacter]